MIELIDERNMEEESVYVCTMCNNKTFESFDSLSWHMNMDHKPPMAGSSIILNNQSAGSDSFSFPQHPQFNFRLSGNSLIKVHPCKGIVVPQQSIRLAINSFDPNEGGSSPERMSLPSLAKANEKANKVKSKSAQPTNYSKFKCSQCDKELSSAHNLERHKLVHTLQKNFVCEFCGLSFKREDNLKDHRCVVNEDGLVARIKRTRNQEEILEGQVALVCPKCGKSFANISNLNKHSKIHEEKKEVCAECGRRFHLKASLKDHITQIHKGGKMLTCPVCQKELKGRNSLFTHLVRFHPEQKNRVGPPRHACPDCGRVFHQSGNLRKHQLTHSENLSYVCSICMTAFKFPEQLRRHKFKHDTSNRFPCQMCDKTFSMEYELKSHVEVYHGGMSYVCKYCSLSCKHLQGFRRHLQRRHDDETEWKVEGLAFLKASRVANNHYVNVKVRKESPEGEESTSAGSPENCIQPEVPVQLPDHQISPDAATLAYLTTEQLTSLDDLDVNLISLASNGHRLPYYDMPTRNEGKVQLNDIVDEEMSIKVSNQIPGPLIFDPSLAGQAPRGAFKEDQEGLISSSLANLAEFISFPVSESTVGDSPYMACLDDCS